MTTSPITDSPYDPLNALESDPIAQLAEARRRCPVSQPRPGVFVLANHSYVKHALQDPETYSSEDNFVLEGGTPTAAMPATPITMLDPPAHTDLRERLRTWFTPAKLRREEPRIRHIVTDALAGVRPGHSLEVWSTLGRAVPARTVYAFLGLPEADWDTVQRWSDVVNDHLPQAPMDMPEMAALAGYLASWWPAVGPAPVCCAFGGSSSSSSRRPSPARSVESTCEAGRSRRPRGRRRSRSSATTSSPSSRLSTATAVAWPGGRSCPVWWSMW